MRAGTKSGTAASDASCGLSPASGSPGSGAAGSVTLRLTQAGSSLLPAGGSAWLDSVFRWTVTVTVGGAAAAAHPSLAQPGSGIPIMAGYLVH
jgi:hypothetical protein